MNAIQLAETVIAGINSGAFPATLSIKPSSLMAGWNVTASVAAEAAMILADNFKL